MSSTIIETIALPFGKVPPVAVMFGYQGLVGTPSLDEMDVAFNMLDALLKDLPIDQWEH
jgi:hypothetical protein